MISLGGFLWRAYDRYATHDSGRERFLVPDCLPTEIRHVYPFSEHTGLFLEFAELDQTAGAVLEFASRFGHLRGDARRSDSIPEGFSVFDNLSHWFLDIESMRDLVSMWNASNAGNVPALEPLVRLSEKAEAIVDHRRGPMFAENLFDTRRSGLEGAFTYPVIAPRDEVSRQAAIVEAASRHVANIMSRNLVAFGRDTETVLGYDTDSSQYGFWTRPVTLRGGLWLQFAQAVIGRVEHRQCRTCGRWFSITPDTNRSQKVFCRDACKAKDYRDRKKTAAQLASEGKSVAEIAGVLDTPKKTIAGWIEKKG